MKSDSTLELVEMLFKISRFMKEEMSFTNELTHLSVLQIQTLVFLNQKDVVSMSDIAEHFHIELPSATSLLNKLCDQKWVNRYADKKDRRLVLVELTTVGKTLLEQVIRERRKKLEKMLSLLSPEEKLALSSILQTLNTKLRKIS